jgi:serine protease Do
MNHKKWYVVIGVLIIAAAISFHMRGKTAGPDMATPQPSANPRPITFDRGLPTLSGLVKETKPSVVNISTTTVVKGIDMPGRFGNMFKDFLGNDEFLDKFLRDEPTREFKQKSLGSGVIIDREGFILTNNHVVERASSIKVKLSDGKEYDA